MRGETLNSSSCVLAIISGSLIIVSFVMVVSDAENACREAFNKYNCLLDDQCCEDLPGKYNSNSEPVDCYSQYNATTDSTIHYPLDCGSDIKHQYPRGFSSGEIALLCFGALLLLMSCFCRIRENQRTKYFKFFDSTTTQEFGALKETGRNEVELNILDISSELV